jgi:cytochrome c-type biogenesis protein
MIPLVVGYVGGSRDLPRARAFTLSLMFAIGLALTFMLLGVGAALIGGLVGASTTWWYYLVAFVCFVIGLKWAYHQAPLWLGGLERSFKGAPGVAWVLSRSGF